MQSGHVLNLSANSSALMMFISGEKLGELSGQVTNIFQIMLEANNLGGKFGNIRITYDSSTTVFWLCRDLAYEDLSASLLESEVTSFLKNAVSFLRYIRLNIIEPLNEKLTDHAVSAAPFEGMPKAPAAQSPDKSTSAPKQYSVPPEFSGSHTSPSPAGDTASAAQSPQNNSENTTLMDIMMNQNRFLMI